MSAVFVSSGALEETETEIATTELPVAVIVNLKMNYKGEKITEAAKITKASDEINYEAEIKGNDIIFVQAGKLLKKDKE